MSLMAEQLRDLIHTSEQHGWSAQRSAPWLERLAAEAAVRSAEQAEIEGAVAQRGAAAGTTTTGGAAGADKAAVHGQGGQQRAHYLAQLVPAMMRHSATRFGQVLRETQTMVGRHRREREQLVAELRLLETAPPPPPPPPPPATELDDVKVALAFDRRLSDGAADDGATAGDGETLADAQDTREAGWSGPWPGALRQPSRGEGSIDRLLRGSSIGRMLSSLTGRSSAGVSTHGAAGAHGVNAHGVNVHIPSEQRPGSNAVERHASHKPPSPARQRRPLLNLLGGYSTGGGTWPPASATAD